MSDHKRALTVDHCGESKIRNSRRESFMNAKRVLVTGASGLIGGAVARAFHRAGWTTYALIRKESQAPALAQAEIIPLLGDPGKPESVQNLGAASFDVIVSNTEDLGQPVEHLRQVRQTLDYLTAKSLDDGTKTLVIFTSGSKDYGDMPHGEPVTAPHSESSPINPHPFAAPRSNFAQSLLAKKSPTFDAVVVRPALVYGRSSGLYGLFFAHAEKSSDKLVFKADEESMLHSVHVDDCAAAYVALATVAMTSDISGQAFNVANAEYETAAQVARALADSYGLEVQFEKPATEITGFDAHLLANTSQWVDSTKLRELTGWAEQMQPFTANIDQYRMAYEANRKL
ncbi:NAD-dependent epimerase/dehydratase family protein [Amycolatopsis pigmentata]|uniref:NAD-dependent epimerase/dehydratase family protein n=1 Tax=Amycolatopsis pigmentata TaxID=450801 RepID=A0ABW5FKX4_9PSEU